MSEERFWVFPSASRPHQVYSVTRDIFGDFSCTCPDFQFRKRQCKHIQKAKMLLAGENQKNKLLEGEL